MTLTVEDRVALTELVARYAAGVDERDFDAVCSLFTADATLAMPEPPRHMEPVIEVAAHDIRGALGQLGDFPVTQHAVLGHVVDEGIGAGLATGTVACAANHLARSPDGRVRNLVWHLRYRDDYRRTDSGWRFARRSLRLDWIESRPVAVWRGPEAHATTD